MGSGGFIHERVQGTVRHDDPDGGRPVKIGGYADIAAPTAVAVGDRVNAYFDRNGRFMVKLDGLNSGLIIPIQGFLDHDASGAIGIDPLLVGGRASAAAPSDVSADGDAVMAWLDRAGRTAVFSDQIFDVGGDVAHDAVDSGNPIKTGGRAVSHGASPTAVAAADRTDHLYNRHGIPFGMTGHPNTKRSHAQRTTTGTTTFVTPTAGSRIVVMAVSAFCKKANTNNTVATFKLGASIISQHGGVAPGSGYVEAIGGILAIGGTSDALTFTCDTPGGAVDAHATYYEIEG